MNIIIFVYSVSYCIGCLLSCYSASVVTVSCVRTFHYYNFCSYCLVFLYVLEKVYLLE